MAYSKEALEMTHRQFAQKREDREGVIAERKMDLYSRYPRLEELEREASSLAYRIFAKVAKGGADLADIQKVLEGELSRIHAEQAEVLAEDGKTPDYFDPPFECPNCHDTGFIGNRMCSCFENALSAALFSESNMTERMRHQTFENMRFDVYSEKVDASIGESVRSYMEKIRDICINFVETFDTEYQNLLFYGDSGLGKTYYSSAIANALLAKGKTVCYQSAPVLFSMLQQRAFDRDRQEYDTLRARILTADLFILDDLGTEMITNFTVPEFFQILNLRLLDEKPMIISTNLSMREIKENYSERISSRLGVFTPCFFVGKDLRKQSQ